MAKGHCCSEPQRTMEKLLLRANLVLAAAIAICCLLIAVQLIRERGRPDPAEIAVPGWVVRDFLKPNEYSRSEKPLTRVRDIVIHYVGNPGTDARQNRDYFNSLADQQGEPKVSASSHFIIGLDGTVLQVIPLGEVAYANYPRNYDTISIECCHPDDSGEFTDATRQSLIRLTAWLCEELGLSGRHVLRHHDVSGKVCPKYYVDHEAKWLELKNDIKRYGK